MAGEKGATCARVKFVRRLPRSSTWPSSRRVNRDAGLRRKTESVTMKTNNKINAYILRGSAAVLLFSCVIVALCSAINLREQAPKTLRHYNRADGTLNDGKVLIWSLNSIGGGGSAAREDLGGNPGARLRISTSASFGIDTVTAIKDDFTTSIPFEGDTFTFSVDFLSGAGASGHGQALLLVVRQGNDIYGLPLGATGVQANWATLVFNGAFNQAAFIHILGPGSPTPDFTSGVRTHFGFAGQNSFSSMTSYYDNFHLVIDAVSTCVPPPPNLVSWWPGDGNADDIVDGNNGTLQGGATFAQGEVDQAFLLDGIDDFVDVGNAANLHVSQGEFTVDAWVNFNALTGDMSILDKMSIGGGNFNADGWRLLKQVDERFWFCFGGGTFNGCGGNGGSNTVMSTTTASTGTWFHIAAVKNAVEIAIYVNGVMEASKPTPTFTDTNSTNLLIGGHNGPDVAYLNGLIDEADIYDRALSQAEIQAIYNAGSAGKCRPQGTPTHHGHCHCHCNSYCNCNSNANGHTHGYSKLDSKADSHVETSANARAAPMTAHVSFGNLERFGR